MFKKDFYFEHSPILSYTQCIYNIHRLGPKVQGPFYGMPPLENKKKFPYIILKIKQLRIITFNSSGHKRRQCTTLKQT